jgi:hypothetical protein
MAIKFKYKSKDEVPPEFMPLYAERDGAWVLDADDAVDKAKLEELRKSNLALTRERDELGQRFDGIDPESARALIAERQKAVEEKLLNQNGGRLSAHDEGQGGEPEEKQRAKERERIERVIEGRVKTIKGELAKQVATLTTERDALNARLTTVQIDQGVTTAATKRGLRPTAIPDITSRARLVFLLVNGAPAAFEADGKTTRYGREWPDSHDGHGQGWMAANGAKKCNPYVWPARSSAARRCSDRTLWRAKRPEHFRQQRV